MSGGRVDELIEKLAADARPVRPLAPPLRRALATLAAAALACAIAIYWQGDVSQLLTRYAGREMLMTLEMAAMLATGLLAVTGAFFLSVPGRSRYWLLAPLPPFAAWLMLSGLGCYGELIRSGSGGGAIGHSLDCLLFIAASSLLLGAPLAWRLSRARPIEPLAVAMLGGLGAAAIAAFLLQFFHPFAVTFVDLAVHVAAILLVVGVAALINRRALGGGRI
jgi:hypothetical protein